MERTELSQIKRILLPVEDTGASMRACKSAAFLAKLTGAKVKILNCHANLPSYVQAYVPEDVQIMAVKESRGILGKFMQCLDEEGVQHEEVAYAGDPGPIIIDEINKEKYDLVVMGKTERSLPILASVMDRIIYNTKQPVMIIH
jgi:nucleotide-binding universal stress UspA family protein